MADLGELMIIVTTLAIVAYYRIPGLRAWVQRQRSVKLFDAEPSEIAPLPASQPIKKTAQFPIATPQTARNEPVVIVPVIGDLTESERAVIEVLARLIASGELTQTAAIKVGLGIPPGSRSPRYQAARAAIQAELVKLAPPPEPHPPIRVDNSRYIDFELGNIEVGRK